MDQGGDHGFRVCYASVIGERANPVAVPNAVDGSETRWVCARQTVAQGHDFVFARSASCDYSPDMPLRLHRRLIALVTAVLFVLSTAGHGVMMAEMAAKAIAATADMSLQSPSSDCDGGCGGNDAGMQAACFAHCASTVGIVSASIEVSVVGTVRDAAAPTARSLSGRNHPPDPHPPKRLA
jgi:hypothetical protein